MGYIDFSLLDKIFSLDFSLNRDLIFNHVESISEMRRMPKKHYTAAFFNGEKMLTELYYQIRKSEGDFRAYMDSCSKDAWPIILKRYAEQISNHFQAVKFEILRNGGIITEEGEISLQICGLSFSILADLIDEYNQGDSDIYKFFPESFNSNSDINKISSRVNEPMFKFFLRCAEERGLIDKDGNWIYLEEKKGKIRFYGSLGYFIKMLLTSLNFMTSTTDKNFHWSDVSKIFPQISGQKGMSGYLSKFLEHGPNDKESEKAEKEINKFFDQCIKLYEREEKSIKLGKISSVN